MVDAQQIEMIKMRVTIFYETVFTIYFDPKKKEEALKLK